MRILVLKFVKSTRSPLTQDRRKLSLKYSFAERLKKTVGCVLCFVCTVVTQRKFMKLCNKISVPELDNTTLLWKIHLYFKILFFQNYFPFENCIQWKVICIQNSYWILWGGLHTLFFQSNIVVCANFILWISLEGLTERGEERKRINVGFSWQEMTVSLFLTKTEWGRKWGAVSACSPVLDKKLIALRNNSWCRLCKDVNQQLKRSQQLTTIKGFYDFRYILFGGVRKNLVPIRYTVCKKYSGSG